MTVHVRFGACLGSLLAISATLWAQVPLDLADKKDFRALRLASTDPNYKNADYRRITPGQTLELGKIDGHGRVTHIWFTIAADSPDHLRELVFRIYWDGAQKPAVACPLGDFFGLGFGKYVEYKSAPVAIGGIKALNCYWPMPFAKGARFTLTNEGTQMVRSCYFNIDYRLDEQPGQNIRYFHTQYRQAYPAPQGKDYLILDTKGSGHMVGCFLSIMANSNGWWGEGNDKFYVDGAAKQRSREPEARIISAAPGISSTHFGIRSTACHTTTMHRREENSAASSTPATAGTSSIRCPSRSRCGSPSSMVGTAPTMTGSRCAIIIRRWRTTTWIDQKGRDRNYRRMQNECLICYRCHEGGRILSRTPAAPTNLLQPMEDDRSVIGRAHRRGFSRRDPIAAVHVTTPDHKTSHALGVGFVLQHGESPHHTVAGFEVGRFRVLLAVAAVRVLTNFQRLEDSLSVLNCATESEDSHDGAAGGAGKLGTSAISAVGVTQFPDFF